MQRRACRTPSSPAEKEDVVRYDVPIEALHWNVTLPASSSARASLDLAMLAAVRARTPVVEIGGHVLFVHGSL